VLAAWLRERPVAPQAPELRLVVLDALATLPPRARVVVVMRYWADLNVDQVMELLGCSPGNVKSQSSRPLDKLRAVLEDAGMSDQAMNERHETGGTRHG
jgi:DNA-directed RNA polymerase specialized sigma24 family protein